MLLQAAIATAVQAGSARRMTIRDGKLYEPEHPDDLVLLGGVSFVFTVNRTGFGLTDDDRKVTELLPDANVFRLVMDHFHDDHAVGSSGIDCHSDDPATGHIQPRCLAQFDEVLEWTTNSGVWAIVTGRGSHTDADMPGVWKNSTLRAQMVASWAFLAERYASRDNILGCESHPPAPCTIAIVLPVVEA